MPNLFRTFQLFIISLIRHQIYNPSSPLPFLCRRDAANAVKKPAKDEPDAGDVKVACAEDEMKHEAKDEESNESDGEEKVAGEDADVRDVIYNLEILGIKYCVHFPKTFQAVGSHIE